MEHLSRNHLTSLNMSGEIYWIDDKEGAFPEGAIKDHLEAICGATIRQFIASHDTLDKVLATLDQGAHVSLIVLDYWLANLPRENDPANGSKTEFGSAWAAALRAARPELPIVGVTSESLEDIPDSQKSQFLQLMNREKIFDFNHDSDLKALIDGFPRVYGLWTAAKREPEHDSKLPGREVVDISEIVNLISSPEDTAGYLATVLPEFAKQPWDQETPHEFSRWVLEVLLGRPGFLLDDLELATLLGLKKEGFHKISESFRDALYSGVFASSDRPLWWVSLIRPIFAAITENQPSGPIRRHREKLLIALLKEVDATLLSRPYPDDDLLRIPDCVAFSDEQRIPEHRVQACSEDTVIDPLESPPIGFEARRLWKPAE